MTIIIAIMMCCWRGLSVIVGELTCLRAWEWWVSWCWARGRWLRTCSSRPSWWPAEETRPLAGTRRTRCASRRCWSCCRRMSPSRRNCRRCSTARPSCPAWLSTTLAYRLQGKKVCRYNWHSAGSLSWPFPTLNYKYIFQIKYTETILSNSTRKQPWLEITKTLIAVLKIYYNFWHTFVPYCAF